jgi:hypothetical protein
MVFARTFMLGVVTLVLSTGGASAAAAIDCTGFNPKGDKPMQAWSPPTAEACTPKSTTVEGVAYPVPDPDCTPGAVNPTLKLSVLKRPTFRTACERNKATSANEKNGTYDWYGVGHPADNTGLTQTCELDHLISIEIGGADTLDNIWPECGPAGVKLDARFFKQKDEVENYLAAQVRAGAMKLSDVQSGIARNWTQYLKAANKFYESHKKRNDGG